MAKVSIIYFSGTGHNQLMAEAVAKGSSSVAGTEVKLLRITGDQIKDGRWSDDAYAAELDSSHAIIFGAPTYMGSPAAQFKAFSDWTGGVWFKQGWKDKVAGGFSHSGTPCGDKTVSIQTMFALACQHGMIWVSNGEMPSQYVGSADGVNRLGGFSGAYGAGGAPQGQPAVIDEGDRLTAERYGARVAKVAAKLAQ
jgi:NAD(P)H dehydrogenase (quinone)